MCERITAHITPRATLEADAAVPAFATPRSTPLSPNGANGGSLDKVAVANIRGHTASRPIRAGWSRFERNVLTFAAPQSVEHFMVVVGSRLLAC